MDKAVSNTGPLIHLAEIGEFELLTMVYTKAEFMAFTDDECIFGEA
ncbi:hypothetical protein C5S35_14270 [Candidatus Methanophagaceae archaeon]|nr:hypothetical protein C5S35_14270 [Methanophagales archaeon]